MQPRSFGRVRGGGVAVRRAFTQDAGADSKLRRTLTGPQVEGTDVCQAGAQKLNGSIAEFRIIWQLVHANRA